MAREGKDPTDITSLKAHSKFKFKAFDALNNKGVLSKILKDLKGGRPAKLGNDIRKALANKPKISAPTQTKVSAPPKPKAPAPAPKMSVSSASKSPAPSDSKKTSPSPKK